MIVMTPARSCKRDEVELFRRMATRSSAVFMVTPSMAGGRIDTKGAFFQVFCCHKLVLWYKLLHLAVVGFDNDSMMLCPMWHFRYKGGPGKRLSKNG